METLQNNFLDVALLEPRQKHPTIFKKFDELNRGESLLIKNDHDPKPLYYQLLAERGDIFSWEYLEEGPQVWQVKISKRKEGPGEDTVGVIAAKDIRKAEVFKKYGIDFCCGGKKTLRAACAEKGLDLTKIEKELTEPKNVPNGRAAAYNDWSLEFLADYIVNTHHAYIRKSAPEIRGYAQKVDNVHGHLHPELNQIKNLVEEVFGELATHMVKEEKMLFPYIKELAMVQSMSGQPGHPSFGSVENPISMMELEHDLVGGFMQQIRTLSNNYLIPAEACASYSLLYKMLEEFESDLSVHIHLENNILFPKAIELEKRFKG